MAKDATAPAAEAAGYTLNAPFFARYLALVAVCVGINLAGLFCSQAVHISIFYLDMVGTAIAALLSGMTAGITVAFISSILGTLIVGESAFALFGVVNAVGAICWSVLPRLGLGWAGADIFNPDPDNGKGYRRLASRIFVLGIVTGCACAVAAFIVQYSILGFTDNLNAELHSMSSGSATGRNTLLLAAVLYNVTFDSVLGNDPIWTLLISMFVSNVPDKIISTLLAVICIFVISILHNYKFQYSSNIEPQHHHINGKRAFSLLVFLYIALFIYEMHQNAFETPAKILGVLFVGGFSFLAILLCDYRYIRSIDRNPEISTKFWYGRRNTYGFKREVFEDYLKAFVIIFSLLNFYLAGLAPENSAIPQPPAASSPHAPQINSKCIKASAPTSPGAPSVIGADSGNERKFAILQRPCGLIMIDGKPLPYDRNDFDKFALWNLFFLTGLRYLVVLLMRVTGKFQ